MDTLSETRIPSFALLSKTTNIPDLFMWFTKFWAKLIKFPKWLELHHTTRYSTVLLEQLATGLFQFVFALKFWNFIDSYRYLTKKICTQAAGTRWKLIWDNFWHTTLKGMLCKIVTKWSFSVFIQSFTTYSIVSLLLFLLCQWWSSNSCQLWYWFTGSKRDSKHWNPRWDFQFCLIQLSLERVRLRLLDDIPVYIFRK